MSKLLTTAEAAAAVGMPLQTLLEWVSKKHVTPAIVGGKNNSHRWTRLQVTGLAIVVELRSTARGCLPAYAGQVVAAFGRMREDELVAKLDAGGTNFAYCATHKGKPLLADFPHWPDVRQAYDRVKKAADNGQE